MGYTPNLLCICHWMTLGEFSYNKLKNVSFDCRVTTWL